MVAQKANCPATKKIQTIALGDARNSQFFGSATSRPRRNRRS